MKKILAIFILCITISSQGAFAIPIEQMYIYEGGIFAQGSVAPGVGNSKNGEFPVVKVDRNDGYYVDGRNQFPAEQTIMPPHPELIPAQPHPSRSVEPFESYYDRNVKGMRRQEYMTPIIPNYNRFYSERENRPYTKNEYLDLWCDGEKDYKKGSCTTSNHVVYFYRASEWSWGVTKIPFQVRNAKKQGKKVGLFLCVTELAGDAPHMHDAKDFAELFNIDIYFGTIDSYIPGNWVI